MKPDLPSDLENVSHLLLIEDLKGKRLIHLESASYTLGRDLSNSIVLFSQMVSRHHATLLRVTTPESNTHQFRLLDGNLLAKRSTNGMTVNGKPFVTHDLQHGDTIVFGRHVKARYYAISKMSDLDCLKVCPDDEVSGFLSQLNNPFTESTLASEDAGQVSEAALVRLASFPEMFNHPIWEIDLSGNITYLNPVAISQFPELKKLGSQHPFVSGLIEAIAESKDTNLNREVRVEDRVFQQYIHYIHASQLIRTYVIDITDRHKLETTLKERQQRWDLLFERGFEFIWLLTPEGRIIEANRIALELINATQTQVCDRLFWETQWWQNSPDTEAKLQEAIKCASKGEIVEQIMEIKGADNSLISLKISFKPVKDEYGEVVLSICQGDEVAQIPAAERSLPTEDKALVERIAKLTKELEHSQKQLQDVLQVRKQIENALNASRTTNQALLNIIPEWIFRIDRSGKFVNYRVAPGINSPIPETDLLTKTIDDIFPQPVAKLWRDRIGQALSSGKMQLFSYQLLKPGGTSSYEARLTISATNEVAAIIRYIPQNNSELDFDDELTGDLRNLLLSKAGSNGD